MYNKINTKINIASIDDDAVRASNKYAMTKIGTAIIPAISDVLATSCPLAEYLNVQ